MAVDAALTRLQLAQRLWRESGRIGTGPAASASDTGDKLRMFDAIDDAWRNLQLEPRRWRWMRATTTGALVIDTIAYNASAVGTTNFGKWWPQGDEYQPYLLDPDTSLVAGTLDWIEYEDFRERYQRQTHTAAMPLHLSESPAGQLLVGPKPDKAYPLRVDYESLPTKLGDGESPGMPARFHTLLVWMALKSIATADGDASHIARAEHNRRPLKSALLDDQGESPGFDECEPLA